MKTYITLAFFVLLNCIALYAGEICLAEFDLAGMPVDALPPSGTELRLEPEAQPNGNNDWAVYWDAHKLGYIPARFRVQVEDLLRERIALTLRAKQLAENPRPGQFLQVELWVTPRFPGEDFPEFNPPVESIPPDVYAAFDSES